MSAVKQHMLQCHNLLKVTALPCGMRCRLSRHRGFIAEFNEYFYAQEPTVVNCLVVLLYGRQPALVK